MSTPIASSFMILTVPGLGRYGQYRARTCILRAPKLLLGRRLYLAEHWLAHVPGQLDAHCSSKLRIWTATPLLRSTSSYRDGTALRQGLVCCQRDSTGDDHLQR